MGHINKIKWLPFLTIVSLIFILTISKLNSYYVDAATSRNGLFTIILLLLIFLFSWHFKKTNLEKISILFCVLCVPSFLFFSDGLISFVLNVSVVLAVPGGLLLGRLLYDWHSKSDNRDLLLFIFLVPVFYSIFFILVRASTSISDVRDSVFVLCCFVPFVLLLKSRFKYLILVLLLYLILLSAKRSSIIYAGIILSALIIGSIVNDKHKIVRILKILFSLLIIGYVGLSLIGDDYISIFDSLNRFEDMSADGGSGRAEHYGLILLSFSDSDTLSQLFGHGLHSVAEVFGMPAHNDVLEVLFDFGLIAAIAFISIILMILIQGFKHLFNKGIRKESIYQVGVVLGYLCIALMNCMITNPLYYLLLFAAISFYYTEFTISCTEK